MPATPVLMITGVEVVLLTVMFAVGPVILSGAWLIAGVSTACWLVGAGSFGTMAVFVTLFAQVGLITSASNVIT
jgi:hypothetical protein